MSGMEFVTVHVWMHACMMRAHCDYKGGDTCTCIFRLYPSSAARGMCPSV